jgi:hypothetical protein
MLDPATAPARPDLGFLKVRSAPRRKAPAAPAPVTQVAPAPPVTPVTPAAPAPTAAAAPPPVSLDLDLDLSAPSAPAAPLAPPRASPPAAPAAPAAPAPVFSGGLLDLDEPEDEPAPPTTPGHASTATWPAGGPAASAQAAPTDQLRELGPRIPENGRAVLTPSAPTVALTRLASGIGTLTVEAAISSEVGEISLGCAYDLTDGTTSFLDIGAGARTAPADARIPLLVGSRRRFARIGIDLRQVRSVKRILLVLHSVQRTAVTWGGTLVLTTHSGDRVEVPLDPASPGVAVAAVSLYQVRGELVLRAELDTAPTVREACADFGYDAITWLDDRSPLG